ncbi:Qat anti-phage system QueC-like protein QatC [Rubinisphaera brasiliensis]|uniref:7-cyano-7-deazaguanine synthase n=1 Tax=Rubinisphaera brasiliensis (strain ATCC 49424 / DSM 5305 / JCM 21570 / IAM 15109 / NBRC 103401 / IFAM 1448) TaxID=756272 RepID=F0SJ43_RUBBR|nr:Qat anti-phage system QueC-like protein QatC [Rubinisphaera brasiliensis]ADY58585.1 hypothetical protein Plabr_0964 [Rubinisphaera brasiliensis DSM 5305]
MEASIQISADQATSHEGASTTLFVEGHRRAELYCDYSSLLKAVRSPTERSLDFLNIASTVYSLDKLMPRIAASDGWSREFEVTIPVQDSSVWAIISETLNECVSFLSGDWWRFSFVEREASIIRRKRRKRRRRIPQRFARGNVACLFSGGLDSLAGAVDFLAFEPEKRLSLVGHYDPTPGTVKKDQTQLKSRLSEAYPNRLDAALVCVGSDQESPESSMRSRSLLFVALGICVAEHLGAGVPLLVPENGTIALNVPLTPARRGSCSTRTTHPHYIDLLQQVLTEVGLDHAIKNPLLGKTKGEVVSQCLDPNLIAVVAHESKSCAKPGHKSHWTRKSASQCGQCMPCIYRRAALHTVELDNEVFGNDICTDEVRVDEPSEAANDLRACLSFLRSNHSNESIAKLLIASGPLSIADALHHAQTVGRAMEEIRQLLRDKGNQRVKQLAGLR